MHRVFAAGAVSGCAVSAEATAGGASTVGKSGTEGGSFGGCRTGVGPSISGSRSYSLACNGKWLYANRRIGERHVSIRPGG